MKKKFLFVALSFMLFCTTFFFFGCEPKLKPYIKVYGIATEYLIGDTLSLSTAVVHYYEDDDTEWFSKYNVTREMVSGFSTEKSGVFTMTITYNDLTTTLEYTVIDPIYLNKTDIEIFELVEQESRHSNKIKVVFEEDELPRTIICTSTCRYQELNDEKMWLVKEEPMWSEYVIKSQTIEEVSTTYYEKHVSTYDGEDARDYLFEEIDDFINNFIGKEVIENGYKFYFQNQQREMIVITSLNRKIKSIVNSSTNETKMFYYNEEIIEDSSLPTDVEWEEIEFDPSIIVVGLKTQYCIGEELDVSQCLVKYYENSEATPVLYELTIDMVSGFSTASEGPFSMIITFDDLTYSIDYVVVRDLEIIMNEAQNNILLAQRVMLKTKSIIGDIKTIVAEDKMYSLSPLGESWTIKEEGVWYDYDVITITVSDEEVTTYQKSISETTGASAIAYMFGGDGEEALVENVSYEAIINEGVITGYLIKYSETASDEQTIIDYEIIITNNKIDSVIGKIDGEIVDENYYKYDDEAEVIPCLPEPPDGVWDIV